MGEYKKKSVKRVKPEKDERPEKIKMKPTAKKRTVSETVHRPNRDFKVIRGTKGEARLAPLVITALVILIACGYFIILSFNPIGVFETISSAYKRLGSSGGYDISLSGDKIIDVRQQNSTFYLLTESEALCFNANGKSVSAVSHGFGDPIIKTSKTRALIYGQGGKHLKIYNYNDIKTDLDFESQILSADIANNGSFAVAGYTSGYDSVVKVYNKKNEVIFEWYSADGVVSNVALTPDGKKVYITTFNSSDGQFNSKLSLFNFKSANAERSFSFMNDLPYNIYAADKNSVFAVFENKVCHYNFKTGTETVKTSDYSTVKAFYSDKGLSVVSGLSANADKNHILLFNNKGDLKSELSFDFTVSDISLFKGSYYLLSAGKIYKCDADGNLTHSCTADADIERIVPISDKIVAAVKKSSIIKSELKELQ